MLGEIEIQLGSIKTKIPGGRYLDKPDHLAGIKLAEELNAPCVIDIPIPDFDIPDEQVFRAGLIKGIMLMAIGTPLYVGCVGGVGRTGLYFAGLMKVVSGYRKRMRKATFDPILKMRQEYLDYAIETPTQERFIENLDVDSVVSWWYVTQRVLDGTHYFKDSLECKEGVDLGYDSEAPTVITQEQDQDRVERLEGCVLELDRRLRMQEAARAKVLRELATLHRKSGKNWWKFWVK